MNSSDYLNNEISRIPITSISKKQEKFWNYEHERILLVLHKYANIQYKKYHETYIRYRQKLAYYRIPIIIITGIMGLLSISNASYIPTFLIMYISLLVGISNVAVTTISLIEIFKKIEATKSSSLQSYITYKQISDELSLILRLPPADRNDTGIGTINKYFKIFEKCQITSPILQINSIDLFELEKLEDITNEDFIPKQTKKKWSETLCNMGNNFIPKEKSNNKNPIKTDLQSIIESSNFNSKDIERADYFEYNNSIDSCHCEINNIDDLRNITEISAKSKILDNCKYIEKTPLKSILILPLSKKNIINGIENSEEKKINIRDKELGDAIDIL
jgi:hypothetical protein